MYVCMYIYIYIYKPKQGLRIAGSTSVTELRCRVFIGFRV